MKKSSISRVPVLDLNFSAFQYLNGNCPQLELQGNRVIFFFAADDMFYRLSEKYNRNETVNVLDFVNATRQLRSMMMSIKNQNMKEAK